MRVIIGISGASGAIIGISLLRAFRELSNIETHLVISKLGWQTLEYETSLSREAVPRLTHYIYDNDNMTAAIASGSFDVEGMVICPCSMKTVAAICCGYSDNLLLRAADVCLKENRRLVLVPREMPLGKVHLRNLSTAAELGCIIVPPFLTFYNRLQHVDDHINHIIGKILAQFGLHYCHFKPWRE